MPQLSPTMESGTLARWLVGEGDPVASGDVLAEIETDKATMELEAVDEGRVGRLLVAEGTHDIPVNRTIAVLLEEGESDDALDDVGADAPTDAKSEVAPPPDAAPPDERSGNDATRPARETDAPRPDAGGERRIRASPLARSMAKQAGLVLADIVGSGPGGRIVKRDVEAALAGTGRRAGQAAPAAPSGHEEIRLSGMRRIIAERLQEAKRTIPHFYLTVDCALDRLLDLREQANSRTESRLSVNDFIIRALALALKDVPAANASWGGDVVHRYHHVDLCVAVAVPDGLVTPVLRSAETLSVADISARMRDLAGRAREGRLLPEEYRGGSFTLSNLGMYGIRQFDAVINPPQAGILAVGAGEKRPVVREDGALGIATVMSCTLSCDHRVIDGALGAELLVAFKGHVETPAAMLVRG